jgi:hypothetical protein
LEVEFFVPAGTLIAVKLLKGRLPGESPSGICIQEEQTSPAHHQRNILHFLSPTETEIHYKYNPYCALLVTFFVFCIYPT